MDEILAQGLIFFLGGYDTTASSMTFLLYNLACSQQVQDELIEEIDQVMADKVTAGNNGFILNI